MMHASGCYFSRFSQKNYFSSFLAFKSSFGKYMLPLNGTKFQTNLQLLLLEQNKNILISLNIIYRPLSPRDLAQSDCDRQNFSTMNFAPWGYFYEYATNIVTYLHGRYT